MTQVTPQSNDPQLPFKSVGALRAQHTRLLHAYSVQDPDNLSEEFKGEVRDFMRQASDMGALLYLDDDRADAQTYLSYWTTVLYDAGEKLSTPSLAPYSKKVAAREVGDVCPYRGLQPFRKEDYALFFGRQRLVREMINLVGRERFLGVVGLSGSGKSSLVRAGLIPKLEAGGLPNSDEWLYLDPIVPGSDPLASLAAMIRPEGADPGAWRKEQKPLFLKDSKHLLHTLSKRSATTVVVVDQFEELFTLARVDDEKRAFIDNLVQLAKAPSPGHVLVITIRSEFDPFIGRYPELQEMYDRAQVRVPALSAADLRKAIEKPAEQLSLVFEPGLAEELAQRVQGEPAGLPLLQFTLKTLWERRDGQTITWAKYKELGGSPRDVLAAVADNTYNSFGLHEDRDLSRRIFLRLVRPGVGVEEVTSNRALRSALYMTGDHERVNRILRVWESAGLLRVTYVTPGQVSEDDSVEVTHEALIRNWPELIRWVESERVRLHRRLLLTAAAEQWLHHGRDPGGLLGGSLLDEAKGYDDRNPLEEEFVNESLKAADAAKLAAEKARQREAAVQKLKLKFSSALLGVAVTLLGVAGWQFARAVEATKLAEEAKGQAESAGDLLRKNTELASLALAKERTRSEDELRATKDAGEQQLRLLRAQKEEVSTEVERLKGQALAAQAMVKDEQKKASIAVQVARGEAQKILKGLEDKIAVKEREIKALENNVLIAQKTAVRELEKAKEEERKAERAMNDAREAQKAAMLITQQLDQTKLSLSQTTQTLQQFKEENKELRDDVKKLVTDRPGILIQGGRFATPPEQWKNLESSRAQIEKTLPGIGLITGADGSHSTAFLVSDDVVLTTFFGVESWKSGVVDFSEKGDSGAADVFKIMEVIGTSREKQFALLRVQRQSTSGRRLPPPLKLAAHPKLEPGRPIYIVGYPFGDSRADPEILKIAFDGALGVKRLQPGYLLSFDPAKGSINHDSFTTAGNGGSPVFDLETGRVIGLHWGGQQATRDKGPGLKEAWLLSTLANHPHMKKAGVKFQ